MVFQVFFQDSFLPGTILKCDRVVVMPRLHLAKLVKPIPRRFTRENQITFPFCSVNPNTQNLHNEFTEQKRFFTFFTNVAFPLGQY